MSPDRTAHGSLVLSKETIRENAKILKQKLFAIVCDHALPKSVRDVANVEWVKLMPIATDIKYRLPK